MEQQPLQNIQPPQVEEINIREYFRIIYQFRYLVVLIFVIAIIGTILYTYQQPRIYSATSKILLENQATGADFLMLTGQGTGKNYINNQIQLIKSKPLLTAAWEIMKKNPEWEAYPISATENPIVHLGEDIKVEALRETDVLNLSYESTNPGEAMAAANAIADAVVQQNNQVARLEYTTVREFLGEQLDLISRRLQASEEDLRAFKNENKIAELTETTKKWIEQTADLESQYESALTDQAVKAKTLEVLRKQLKDQDSLMVEVDNVLRAPYIEQLRKDITNTQATITKLRTNENYSSDHPQIKLLQEELAKIKATLDAEIKKYISKNLNYDPLSFRNQILTKIVQAEVELEMARTQVQGLEQTKAIFEDRIITLPDKELQLARLTRNMALDEKIYAIMMEKYEDARIAEQAKIGNIRVIDYAERPDKPIKPNIAMNLLVGILLGLGLGIATALIVHSMDTKLRTLEDIENYVRLPIMGTIPIIQESESRIMEFNRMIEQSEGENKEQLSKSLHYVMMQLVSHYAPKSPISEAYRTLRTNIISKKPEGSTSILVTSPGPKEGKSTTVANLAITFSQMNAKVILIDMDMRRPMIHNKFALEKENGISDYLIDPDVPLKQIIKASGVPNLDIITSGFIPPNPSELISSPRTDKLIEELKSQYDFIFFDTPPIIAVTDALILTKKVDLTFFVVRCGTTEKGIVKRAKDMMENINANIDGIIVNGVYVQKYYSKSNYYYYYYYYYYGEEIPKKQKKANLPFIRKNKSIP